MLDKFDLDDYMQKVYPLDDIVEAFHEQATGKYLKIMIKCNDDIDDDM